MNIPLTKPYWGIEEEKIVVRALRSSTGAGDGPWSKKLVHILQRLLTVKYVFPVTSCTHGLELAMVAMGVGPGDEVVVPSFTMSSTANCVVLAGATPVFADIDPQTFCIDPRDISRCINKKTKGIIIVHYAGMPCAMEKILAIAKKNRLFVVEDAAHSIGASYRGKPLGTWGDIGVFSFHGTKNISSGEGGALVTNRDDLIDVLDVYRANGTNRKAFLDGLVDKYTWVGKGTSFFLSDILSAILVAQLRKIKIINRKRERIAALYTKAFRPFSDYVRVPVVSENTVPNWHIYALKFTKKNHADRFLSEMQKAGVGVVRHYVPIHSSPMGRKIAGKKLRALPVTEDTAETLVRLPIYPGLTGREVSFITAKGIKILKDLRVKT